MGHRSSSGGPIMAGGPRRHWSGYTSGSSSFNLKGKTAGKVAEGREITPEIIYSELAPPISGN